MNEDKRLYNQFLNGNNNAFNDLISKYKNNVIYFISRYVKNIDVAEDIFQDVIVYILENKDKYNFDYSFKTYLYIIAKSKALNYIKNNKINNIELSEIADSLSEDKLLEIVFSNERKNKIQKVINQLKTDYQVVIYLTQIEGLSYKETSQIMNKTEKQIKNLTYNAKKSLKKLLVKEKVVEMKHNKFIRLLSWFIIFAVVSTGIVYAAMVIRDKINNAKLNANFTGSIGNVEGNQVWVGTFNLVWNELIEQLGGNVEFEEGNSELANELNKKTFTKEMLNEDSYYIKSDYVSKDLRQTIENDLKNKFNTQSKVLDKIDWNSKDEYLLYAMLRKEFTFKYPFLEKKANTFGDSTEKVKYFGLEAHSLDECFEQIDVLFYNSEEDFAIKINTVEGEDVILYRTNQVNNFDSTYKELTEKQNKYTGRKEMIREKDELAVPFIKVNAEINYDELCNKHIKNTDGALIKQAVQIVDFELDNYGGNVTSEAFVDMYMCISDEKPRYFNFTDNFVVFLKESTSDKPYFALYVDNTDVLQIAE